MPWKITASLPGFCKSRIFVFFQPVSFLFAVGIFISYLLTVFEALYRILCVEYSYLAFQCWEELSYFFINIQNGSQLQVLECIPKKDVSVVTNNRKKIRGKPVGRSSHLEYLEVGSLMEIYPLQLCPHLLSHHHLLSGTVLGVKWGSSPSSLSHKYQI